MPRGGSLSLPGSRRRLGGRDLGNRLVANQAYADGTDDGRDHGEEQATSTTADLEDSCLDFRDRM